MPVVLCVASVCVVFYGLWLWVSSPPAQGELPVLDSSAWQVSTVLIRWENNCVSHGCYVFVQNRICVCCVNVCVSLHGHSFMCVHFHTCVYYIMHIVRSCLPRLTTCLCISRVCLCISSRDTLYFICPLVIDCIFMLWDWFRSFACY